MRNAIQEVKSNVWNRAYFHRLEQVSPKVDLKFIQYIYRKVARRANRVVFSIEAQINENR